MKDRTPITLSEIESSGANLALLGTVVTWRLMGIRVQEADLKAALTRAGLESHMPALPTPRKALRRTLEAWIAERTRQQTGAAKVAPSASTNEEGEDDLKQRTLIRVINRPGAEHLVFGIVSEDVDMQALGLSYGTQLRILLHKKTGQILCTTDARGVISAENESIQVARELQPYWSEFRTLYFSEDLSRMVRSIISGMSAVSLRKEGGVYFVPASEQHQVELTRSLIASLPTSGHEQPYLCALPVPDVEATKGQMARAVHYGFMDEIRAMSADLERFVEAKPGTVKSETIADRLQQYKDVKAKVSMYATLLSLQQDNIVKELDALTEKARAIVLGGKSAAGSVKTPAAPATGGGESPKAPTEIQEQEPAAPPVEEKTDARPRVTRKSAAEPEALAASGIDVPPGRQAEPRQFETMRLFV